MGIIKFPFDIADLNPLWWFDFSRTDKMTLNGIEVVDASVVDGTGTWTQGTASQRADVGLGVANRATLNFNLASSEVYAGLNVLSDPALSFELVVVANTLAGGSTRSIYSQNDGTGTGRSILGVRNDGTLTSFLGGTNTTGTTDTVDGKFHVLTYRHNPITNVFRCYVDGALEVTNTISSEPANGAWVLGANKNSNGNFYDGDIGETFMLPGEVSDVIFNAYQKALCAKWQIEYKG